MFRALPIDAMVRTVAELGYEYIELSLRADFMPFFLHSRADDERIAELKRALRDRRVQLSSVLPLYTWSSPDESERQAAVRYWKRMIEITADLECPLMNSEFNGRPERAAESEDAFWRSLEELLPLFEREGIALNREAHPDDFCEENAPAVDLVRAIDKPRLNYLYCAPHSFHLWGPTRRQTSRTPSTTKVPLGYATSSTRLAPRLVSISIWTSGRVRSTGPRSSVRCGG